MFQLLYLGIIGSYLADEAVRLFGLDLQLLDHFLYDSSLLVTVAPELVILNRQLVNLLFQLVNGLLQVFILASHFLELNCGFDHFLADDPIFLSELDQLDGAPLRDGVVALHDAQEGLLEVFGQGCLVVDHQLEGRHVVAVA